MIFNSIVGGKSADIVIEHVEDVSFTATSSTVFTFNVSTTYNIKELLGITIVGAITSTGGTTNIPVVGGLFSPITIGDNYTETSQMFECVIQTQPMISNGACTISENTIALKVNVLTAYSSAAYPQSLSNMKANVTYIPK